MELHDTIPCRRSKPDSGGDHLNYPVWKGKTELALKRIAVEGRLKTDGQAVVQNLHRERQLAVFESNIGEVHIPKVAYEGAAVVTAFLE